MSVISRLIVVQPDTLLSESLRFAFEREGVSVASCGSDESFDPGLFSQPAELVIAGGRTGEEARAVLSLVRGVLAAASRRPPVLYVGNGIARAQALAEGATEFLGHPVFVRDAVTVARLLAGRKRDNPAILTGELGDHFGLFYLVRAVSALGRRGVLTLVRGMRRGELRFYDGEVTSAQVGLLHGLAALHQLLLWTEGRFELRPEDVVRRQQIPLEPAALFADAERFLSEICAVAGALSPSACYERDSRQISRLAGRIPPEVGAVLQLFDGTRTVADVVEDCQYRVFESLRIANRLAELGFIRLRVPAGPQSRPGAAAVDPWSDEENATPTSAPGHLVIKKASVAAASGPGSRRQRRRKRRSGQGRAVEPWRRPEQAPGRDGASALAAGGPVAAAADGEPLVVDWAQLMPGAVGSELGVSPVVPSSVAAGEISMKEEVVLSRSLTQPSGAIEPVPPRAKSPATPGRAPTQPPLFSATEEAFFAQGTEQPAAAESFDDLDEGLDPPQGFWRRLFRSPGVGGKPRRR
jgi:hypothetical protein